MVRHLGAACPGLILICLIQNGMSVSCGSHDVVKQPKGQAVSLCSLYWVRMKLYEQMEAQLGSGIAVGVAFLLGGKRAMTARYRHYDG